MATGWLHRKSTSGAETACCPECDAEVDEGATYCTVCGYDIVRQARVDTGRPPGAPAG